MATIVCQRKFCIETSTFCHMNLMALGAKFKFSQLMSNKVIAYLLGGVISKKKYKRTENIRPSFPCTIDRAYRNITASYSSRVPSIWKRTVSQCALIETNWYALSVSCISTAIYFSRKKTWRLVKHNSFHFYFMIFIYERRKVATECRY